MYDQDSKLTMFTIVNFSNFTITKIFNAGNNRYLTSKLDGKRSLVVQVKKTKQIDGFQLFETNHRNLYCTNENLRIKNVVFSSKDISETDIKDKARSLLCVGFSKYVRKIETNRAIKLSSRKTAESYDSNYNNKWKLKPSFPKSTKRSGIARRKGGRSTL